MDTYIKKMVGPLYLQHKYLCSDFNLFNRKTRFRFAMKNSQKNTFFGYFHVKLAAAGNAIIRIIQRARNIRFLLLPGHYHCSLLYHYLLGLYLF